MSLNVLIMSVNMLKSRTPVHSNIDDKLIYPEIKLAQDMYIHPILGSALYNKIINDINVSGTPLGASYVTLVDDYVLDTLQNYVLAALPDVLSYQFWNKGMIRKQGDNTELPSMSELMDLSNKYIKKAEWYAERLRQYLVATHTQTVLPEYGDQANRSDAINPSIDVFTSPIYLGDGRTCVHLDKNNCNCNE